MIVGLTVLRQLLRFIPTKIHKTVATRAAHFGSDNAPNRLSAGELTALPKPPSWIKGPTSKGRGGEEREGRGRDGRGKGEGEREGRKGMAGPIPNPLLRVCHQVQTSMTQFSIRLTIMGLQLACHIA